MNTEQSAETANAESAANGEMTVSEALEEIAARGSGAWVTRCVIALSFSACVQALESGVSAYIASCVQTDFHASTAQVASLASANYAGQLLGSLLLTPLGDVLGRRQCLIYFCATIAILACLQAFAPSLSMLILCRLMVGFAQGPLMLTLDYVAEVVPVARRGQILNYVCGLGWGVGSVSVNALAYLVIPHYSWRAFVALTATPFFISVWLIYSLVESPRWLMAKGQTAEALAALAFIAEVDGTTLPCSTLVQKHADELTPVLGEVDNSFSSVSKRTLQEYQLLFSQTSSLLLVCLTAQWICMGFTYNGTVIYQGAILGINRKLGPCQFDYGFLIIVSASELLGAIAVIPIIDRPDISFGGRNGTQIAGYSLSAIALVLAGYKLWPVMLYACIARGLINGATAVTNLQVTEVLDVSVRGTGSGFMNAAGLLGSLLSPYWVFAPYSQGVIAMGVAAVMVLVNVFILGIPETALRELDTPEDLDELTQTKLKGSA